MFTFAFESCDSKINEHEWFGWTQVTVEHIAKTAHQDL